VKKLPTLFNVRSMPKFETDGCSGYMSWTWNKVHGRPPPWEGCCMLHDRLYWSSGCDGHFTRLEADDLLFTCVAHSSVAWAWFMWASVRVGGSRYLPFSWRWSFRDRWVDAVRGRKS